MNTLTKTFIIRRFERASMAALAAVIFLTLFSSAADASRIKDIVGVEGVRENQLVGYGLVVGLDGTGDELRNAPFTRQSVEAMLERLGINTRGTNMKTDNIAAVMVTATLPAFARQGTKVDVTIGAIGDAEDLKGGTLLVTPLLGADGEVYAVAQGTVAVAGFSAQGNAASITQGVPTSGRIANGAIVEREVDFELEHMKTLRLALHNPDFTTASRIAETINSFYSAPVATPLDPATISLVRPVNVVIPMMQLMTEIEQLNVIPDQPARVVIDERSGVIVIGNDVRINTVAIAQGNLTIRITETPQVSQPAPFSDSGETVVVDRTNIEVDTDADRRLAVLQEGISLQELVDGLNALGVGPRDMISILQAIKASGAMQAQIQVM